MKSRVTLVLSVVAWGLVLTGTALAGAPDLLQRFCVDESDRANVRTARDDCDVLATGMGYHAGVFTLCGVIGGSSGCILCLGDPGLVPYECFGVPGTQM
jgi:hypothetical protein